jgi:hypothetical protein
MKNKFLTAALFTSSCLPLFAQLEPEMVTQKFFPEPEEAIHTPALAKGEGFTSHREMMDFLRQLAAAHPHMLKLEVAGHSQMGLEIPLLTLGGDGEKTLRLFYFTRVHGNEPAGTEMLLWLAQQLAEDPTLHELTQHIAFYFVPMLNADGAEANTRLSANGVNINRDMTDLQTPEAALLHALFTKIQPHLTVDFHEYQPYHERYKALDTTAKMMLPFDLEFLCPTNPNVPEGLQRFIQNPLMSDAQAELSRRGLSHHAYFSTTQSAEKGLVFEVGNSSPTITCNAFALRNSAMLIVETRGIGMGTTSLKRRVYAAGITALSLARTALTNADALHQTLAQAQASKHDMALAFAPTDTTLTLPFIDASRNVLRPIRVSAELATQPRLLKTAPLPEAYYLLPSQQATVALLAKMGIAASLLPNGQYKVETAQPSGRLATVILNTHTQP